MMLVTDSHLVMQRLDAADNAIEVWDIATAFFKAQQIPYVIYVYCRGYKQSSDDTVILSTMPSWWIERYLNGNYADFDPFFTHCCTTYESTKTGIEYIDDYDYLSAQERQLIIEASETGFISGATCIMRRKGAGPDFGGWNLGTNLDRQAFDQLFKEKGEILRIVAMYIHERLTIHLQKDIEETKQYQKQELSQRQIDCLQLLAEGARTQQIADKLSIQPITVEHHLRQAREKLNATTREQAVARAIINGLISTC